MTIESTRAHTTSGSASKSQTRKTLLAIGIGNAVEWFDWGIYATFAAFISQQLFSKSDPSSAFLATLAIFAVGFVARPFGGFVFGWIGDRRGRKLAMTSSIALASLGSLMIAITPGYAQIGVWASVLLLAARLLQGLAHGGELPSTQTYLSEVAPAERRGLWSSLVYVSGTAGIMLGTLFGAVLTSVLSEAQMGSFGWRIPFFAGAIFGLIGLVMRAQVTESETFTREIQLTASKAPKQRRPEDGLFAQMRANKTAVLRVVGLTLGMTVAFYVWSASTPAYAIAQLGMDPRGALWAGVIANLLFIFTLPLWGKLSDRIGRRPVLIASMVGAGVCYLPATWFIGDEPWRLAVSMTVMLVMLGGLVSILPAVYAELFPTSIRTIGVAVPYAVTVAIFGGTAAYLQAGFGQWFGASGPSVFGVYNIVLLAIGILTVIRMPETRGKEL